MDANKYVELRIYPTYFCVDAKTARGRVPLAAMAESRYSLFTAAQILRRWFSVLTQTVTQTRKNQVELSVLETTKLRNFLSRKVRKCLEMSAKNIRPTFGTKRPRVRIPTLRPNPVEIFRFQPDFSAFSELFPMENSVTFPFDPNATQTGILERKAPEDKFCRLPEHFRWPACAFLFISCRYPTLAMKPLIFCAASFFMPAVTWV